MTENSSIEAPDEPGADVSHKTLFWLERLDAWAHVVVAIFFLILSTAVLVTAGVMFYHSIAGAIHPEGPEAAQTFIKDTLEVLSTLLFAVIILELLRTIITYLQTRDTQMIMKEFLIVGIISSIRKILMVGAESSIAEKAPVNPEQAEHAKQIASQLFIHESIGVVISVVAILLMIGGLIFLNRHYGEQKKESRGQKVEG